MDSGLYKNFPISCINLTTIYSTEVRQQDFIVQEVSHSFPRDQHRKLMQSANCSNHISTLIFAFHDHKQKSNWSRWFLV